MEVGEREEQLLVLEGGLALLGEEGVGGKGGKEGVRPGKVEEDVRWESKRDHEACRSGRMPGQEEGQEEEDQQEGGQLGLYKCEAARPPARTCVYDSSVTVLYMRRRLALRPFGGSVVILIERCEVARGREGGAGR